MRRFDCPTCGHPVYFENTRCLACDTPIGFDADSREMVVLDTTWAPCRNVVVAACNWVVPTERRGALCTCCRLTRTRPADDDPAVIVPFAQTEADKRRLVFQLLELGLPVVAYDDATQRGLAFDLLSSRDDGVTIGHHDGLITLDLAESDDAHREAVRQQLGEAYRTVLGHLRHEIGHYYWPALVEESGHIDAFRDLFGDERADYRAAVDAHYAHPLSTDWSDRFVSAYATMHPWEDWAETFAHHLHILDTLQTTASVGLHVDGVARAPGPGRGDVHKGLSGVVGPDEPFQVVIDRWVPLAAALNAVNRSMGAAPLYPFVLTPTVIDKLSFVDRLVRS